MKSLKPHWVSRMAEVAGGVRSRRRRWKECMRSLRMRVRCVWAREALALEVDLPVSQHRVFYGGGGVSL